MEYDVERAEEKRGELVEIAKEAILRYWKSTGFEASSEEALKVATEVIGSLIEVTPPEKEPLGYEMLTLRAGGRGGGRSVKPGNVFLNVRRLVTDLAAGTFTVIATLAIPWTALLAAIVIWDLVWSNLKVELSEREAAILWTMWVNRDDDCVSDAELLDKVNSQLGAHGRNSISRQELDDALERLKKIKCIQRSKSDPSKWWLREGVQVKYT